MHLRLSCRRTVCFVSLYGLDKGLLYCVMNTCLHQCLEGWLSAFFVQKNELLIPHLSHPSLRVNPPALHAALSRFAKPSVVILRWPISTFLAAFLAKPDLGALRTYSQDEDCLHRRRICWRCELAVLDREALACHALWWFHLVCLLLRVSVQPNACMGYDSVLHLAYEALDREHCDISGHQ